MTNPQNNQPHPPSISPPPNSGNIKNYAILFGDLVRSAIIAMFWAILACIAIAATVIAGKSIYWVTMNILNALE